MEEAYYKLLYDVLSGYDRTTPKNIVSLRNNQIFVFGTDKSGSQKNGAAGLAAKSFGAKVGVVNGPTGMCYALPTKGFSFDDLAHAVGQFENYVRNNTKYTFLVTAVGCGHAGFNVKDVALLFIGLIGLRNVMLPDAFLTVYREQCREYSDVASKENNCNNNAQQISVEQILEYYDESVHEVIKYLFSNNVDFNHDGGFSLTDEEGNVIAEAELGIESEKVVFAPFDNQSAEVFQNYSYTVMTPENYLNSKSNFYGCKN